MRVPEDGWPDPDLGPFVRPYAITKGRTAPAGGVPIGLIDVVVAVSPLPRAAMNLGSEYRQLLIRCQQHVAVADLASEINLPTGVVRVLLSDLLDGGFIRIFTTEGRPAASQRLLREVLDGLSTL